MNSKNIETWHKYNPDYEIIRWDENNIDIDKCAYSEESYNAGAYAFFSNYIRTDIIYNKGGIYLDTDVEARHSFDCLLNDEAFFNMGRADCINNGCGFGAVANNSIIKEIKRRI